MCFNNLRENFLRYLTVFHPLNLQATSHFFNVLDLMNTYIALNQEKALPSWLGDISPFSTFS